MAMIEQDAVVEDVRERGAEVYAAIMELKGKILASTDGDIPKSLREAMDDIPRLLKENVKRDLNILLASGKQEQKQMHYGDWFPYTVITALMLIEADKPYPDTGMEYLEEFGRVLLDRLDEQVDRTVAKVATKPSLLARATRRVIAEGLNRYNDTLCWMATRVAIVQVMGESKFFQDRLADRLDLPPKDKLPVVATQQIKSK